MMAEMTIFVSNIEDGLKGITNVKVKGGNKHLKHPSKTWKYTISNNVHVISCIISNIYYHHNLASLNARLTSKVLEE